MKFILSALIILLNFSYAKSTSLVFLVEHGEQKHIGTINADAGLEYLSTGDAWHLYPTISSDASKIAYVKGSGSEDLVLIIRDLKTNKEVELTKPGFILHPQFSKNDTHLYFSIKIGDKNQIARIDITDLSLKSFKYEVIEDEVSSFFPAPFQSSEILVYQRNSKQRQIVVKDLISGEVEVIGYGMSPALSKDERYIAYTSKVNENWDIYVYDRFLKTVQRITNHKANDFSPTFDKDGNIIYTSDRFEEGVFSILTQDFKSWVINDVNEKLIISQSGVSFYAPRASGIPEVSISLKEELIGTPRSSFGAINHDGFIYAIGGHQGAEHTYPPESFTARVTAYDIKKGQWENRSPRLNPSHGFQLSSFQDSVFAFGGFAYEENNYPKWKSINVVEKYNTKTDSWSEIGEMPRRRSSNASVTIGSKVYLIGGWDATPKFYNDIDGTFHDEIDVYDMETNTWQTLSEKLPKKRRAFSAFAKGDKIYLVGGISESGSHFSLLNDFTEYDTVTGEFKELAQLPFGTFAPAAGLVGNKAYMFGGMFKLSQWEYEYVPHIYEYDFATGNWSHTGRYLHGYKGFSQVVEIENCLGVLGGHSYLNNQDAPLSTFEKFCIK